MRISLQNFLEVKEVQEIDMLIVCFEGPERRAGSRGRAPTEISQSVGRLPPIPLDTRPVLGLQDLQATGASGARGHSKKFADAFPNGPIAHQIRFSGTEDRAAGNAAAQTKERRPMTRHTPETECDETPNDITAHPILPDRDFRRLAPALDLSTDDWLRVLQAHNGLPSSRRDIFRETITQQLEMLSWNVQDDNPCPGSLELARHLAALPHMLKLTVLETIERFWASDAGDFSLEDRLRDMGLRPCTSAHERMAAVLYRQHVLAEESGPADPATGAA